MKLLINGDEIEGDYVEFDANERWTEVLLGNGYKVKIKVVIQAVFVSRAIDPESGLPLVNISSKNVAAVMPPPEEEKEKLVVQ